jgi:hypothetical protein
MPEKMYCKGIVVLGVSLLHLFGTGCGEKESDGGSATSPVVLVEPATPEVCTFSQSATLSPKVATVGIVSWSTTLADVTSARIDFGLDAAYGLTAPVAAPAAAGNTTLLLGMKQARTYHYRITAASPTATCRSEDFVIATGSLPNGLPKISVSTKKRDALSGGFLIIGQYVQTSSGNPPAYIVDVDGDIVWAYGPGGDVTGVAMSYDGSRLWTNASNVPNRKANVHRLSLDGLVDEDLSGKFVGQNHQLTVLPDETVAFFAYNPRGCDDIKEYAPDGQVRTVVNAGAAQGQSGGCHINNIQYSKEDDALVYSDMFHQTVIKIRRSDGATLWVLNGGNSSFTGDVWQGGQHGIHLLGPDGLLIFNNNSRISAGGTGALGGSGDGSIALEFKIDLATNMATRIWSYKAGHDLQTDVLGDVQRLPNGSTVVGYSTTGVLREVDASGMLLQEMRWPLAATFGFIQKRSSLYGPPPR